MNGAPSGSSPELRQWQRRIFASVWITYFAFYLCRANISVAKAPLKETFGWDDFFARSFAPFGQEGYSPGRVLPYSPRLTAIRASISRSPSNASRA